MRHTHVYTCLLFLIFLTACTPGKANNGAECIPPPLTGDIPVRATVPSAEEWEAVNQEIPPLGDWQVQAELPEKGTARSLLVGVSGDIWILVNHTIYRFFPDSQALKTYTHIGDLMEVPEELYLAQDGTVWGTGINRRYAYSNHEYPLLSQYTEMEDRFYFVQDKDKVLHNGMFAIGLAEPEPNEGGNIWLLASEKVENAPGSRYQLVSFDPETLEISQHFATKEATRLQGMDIAPNGEIWFGDIWKHVLYSYNPTTQVTGVIEDLAEVGLEGIPLLYFDRQERLWIADQGWFDFSNPAEEPRWHALTRSPAFITNAASPENQYAWYRPYRMIQSSNGLYWFSAYNGVIKLDPQTWEWCRFTNGESPVAEDTSGNLWIVVFGKLYKLELKSG